MLGMPKPRVTPPCIREATTAWAPIQGAAATGDGDKDDIFVSSEQLTKTMGAAGIPGSSHRKAGTMRGNRLVTGSAQGQLEREPQAQLDLTHREDLREAQGLVRRQRLVAVDVGRGVAQSARGGWQQEVGVHGVVNGRIVDLIED